MASRSVYSAGAVLFFCLLTIGCGSSGASVAGKVVYENDDSPMTKGSVMFISDDGQHHVRGDISSDGVFNLRGAKNEGVKPGKYSVCIVPPDTSSLRENGVNVPPVVDARFLSTQTSGLQFDVKPGKNDFTVKVSKPAGN